jgi:hypothetical protein
MSIICFLGELIKGINSFLGKGEHIIPLAVAAVALWVAIKIPRRIMVNQIFADLVKEYRSSEMGAAILSVCHFYKENRDNLGKEYRKEYENQIENKLGGRKQINSPPEDKDPIDYAHTLHFQRRLIAQFYSTLAYHRYKLCCPRISNKQLRYWFTPNEVKLLGVILHMTGPASNVFVDVGDVPDPLEKGDSKNTSSNDKQEVPKIKSSKDEIKNVPMNELIYKLYKEADKQVKAREKRRQRK